MSESVTLEVRSLALSSHIHALSMEQMSVRKSIRKVSRMARFSPPTRIERIHVLMWAVTNVVTAVVCWWQVWFITWSKSKHSKLNRRKICFPTFKIWNMGTGIAFDPQLCRARVDRHHDQALVHLHNAKNFAVEVIRTLKKAPKKAPFWRKDTKKKRRKDNIDGQTLAALARKR